MVRTIIKYNHWTLEFFPDWVAAWAFRKTVYVRAHKISDALKRHEEKHVEQYTQFGVIGFLVRYLWWSFMYGYNDNPLEVEARSAECPDK